MDNKLNTEWRLICTFADFAQAYTGIENWDDAIKDLAENDQLYDMSEDRFLTFEKLNALRNGFIEIRIAHIMPNGIFNMEGSTASGYEFDCELSFDCVDPVELLKSIITANK